MKKVKISNFPYGKLYKYPDGIEIFKYTNGDTIHYLNGEFHREDGPAIDFAEGDKEWWLYGECLDFKSWMFKVGEKKMKKVKISKLPNGILYKYPDGKEIFKYIHGDTIYYLNGKIHREDGPAIERVNGDKEWYLNDKLHRENGPAVEFANGEKWWFLNGEGLKPAKKNTVKIKKLPNGGELQEYANAKFWYLNKNLHRENAPAINYSDGTRLWHLYGKLHRVDGPAKESPNGYKEWWLKGKLHRVDGPAQEYPDGTKLWYLHGKYSRKDGPAIKYANGDEYWYLNGKFHRANGPAIYMSNGHKQYWIHGLRCKNEKEFNELMKKNVKTSHRAINTKK
jgi:hypothetical protein